MSGISKASSKEAELVKQVVKALAETVYWKQLCLTMIVNFMIMTCVHGSIMSNENQ